MLVKNVESVWFGEYVNVLLLHGLDEHEVVVSDGHVAKALEGSKLNHRVVVVNKVEDCVEGGAHSFRPSLEILQKLQ